jgi:hypothetical protein
LALGEHRRCHPQFSGEGADLKRIFCGQRVKLRSGIWSFIVFLAVMTAALAQSKPKFCDIPSEFEKRVHLYEGCIASRARDFEITGDSAESVATAAIGACDDYKRRIASFIDSCDMAGVGSRTMQRTEKHFHDYAIRSVIEFRAARVSGKRPGN